MKRILIIALSLLLSACQQMSSFNTEGTTQSHSQHDNAGYKTHATSYIYLTPIPKSEKSAYIQVVNKSSTSIIALEHHIHQALVKKGYTLVDSIDEANLVIRATLLRVGNPTNEEIAEMLNSEYGFSATKITLEDPEKIEGPLNYGALVELQVFERNEFISVLSEGDITPPNEHAFLLLNNTMKWERFQTRISAVAYHSEDPPNDVLINLGNNIEEAVENIIRD